MPLSVSPDSINLIVNLIDFFHVVERKGSCSMQYFSLAAQ